MPITVTFNAKALETRSYSGECQTCKSKMEWLREDAKTVVDEDDRRRPYSVVDCPVVDADGNPCGGEVYGF